MDDKQRALLQAYEDFIGAINPIVALTAGPNFLEVKHQEEERFRRRIKELDFPNFSRLASRPMTEMGDLQEQHRQAQAIIAQMKTEQPDLDWLRSMELTESLFRRSFFPGILLADGIWVSVFTAIDSSVILIPPVIIGKKCLLTSQAVVGLYSIAVNSTIGSAIVLTSSLGIA